MTRVVSPTFSIPDYDHEYHTVYVDTIGQASKSDFTVYLSQPIESVVQARLIAASLNSTSQMCHISIEELDTNFSHAAVSDLNSVSSVHRSFGTFLPGSFIFNDNYPIVQQYVHPINKISRLTFSLKDETGAAIAGSNDHFFIFKFVCKKSNLKK